jgi:hypothetical protein
MKRILAVAIFPLALASAPVFAQDLGTSFEDAAFVTCLDAQAMPREKRVALAVALVERASNFYGVPYVEGGALDSQLGTLIRAACTVYPSAYLHNVTATAFRAATKASAPRVPTATPIPFETGSFLTCRQFGQLTDEQQDALEFDFAVRAGQRYGMTFEDTASGRAKLDEGVTPLVQGTCFLTPDFHIYGVVARAVQAAIALQHGGKTN